MSQKPYQINVVKPYLPPHAEYAAEVASIWDNRWVTNQGPKAQALEAKLGELFGLDHVLFHTNGTVVLQIALRVLGVTGEVITTPYSYVATTSSLLWENCRPVFVDIEGSTCGIDPSLIEAAITPQTQAIMATHVYGIPNDVHAIEAIAKKHNLKVIYDAAHAFGVKHEGKSLLEWGDLSTLSFHATKVFHTCEGGALICHDAETARQIALTRSFGHVGDENHYCLGINGKNSEFHAAMGLCNLRHLPEIIAGRKRVYDQYEQTIGQHPLVQRPVLLPETEYNYAYYPIFLPDEATVKRVQGGLNALGIGTRRYFYPSLNELPYLPADVAVQCPVSERLSRTVLSFPLYPDLTETEVSAIITETLTLLG